MKSTGIRFSVILIAVVACSWCSFAAQKKHTPEKGKTDPASRALYKEIAHMDSVVFNAFNARDINTLKQCLDTGLELYQDNIGVRNYTEAITAFSDLFKRDYVLTRKLVKGSLEVYPIKGYGAIQTGLHTFSHIENGKPEVAAFKFMHIWQKKDGAWHITRLVTYDH